MKPIILNGPKGSGKNHITKVILFGYDQDEKITLDDFKKMNTREFCEIVDNTYIVVVNCMNADFQDIKKLCTVVRKNSFCQFILHCNIPTEELRVLDQMVRLTPHIISTDSVIS